MVPRITVVAAAALVWLTAGAQTAPQVQKTVLKHSFAAGQAKIYRITAQLTIADSQNTVDLSMTMNRKCTSVEKAGAKMTAEFANVDLLVNGQEFGDMGRTPPPVKYVVREDGKCSDLASEGEGEEVRLAKFLIAAGCVPFPTDGAAPGDKWKGADPHDLDPQVKGSVDYEFVGPEDIAGTPKALKVKYHFKATPEGASDPMAIDGTVWLDPTTGDLARLEAKLDSLAMGGQSFTGTLRIQPKDDKKDAPKGG